MLRCDPKEVWAALAGALVLVACMGIVQAQPASPSEIPPRAERTNLLVFAEGDGQPAPVRSREDWLSRRAAILRGMQEAMGPMPGPERRVPLDVRVDEEVDCGEYVRRLLSYAAEPGSRVPAYLLIPKAALRPGDRVPGILCLHQTHSLGHKVVVGLGPSPDDEYGVELVRRGFVCLAPAYPLLANYSPDLKALGYQSGTMKAIWDNRRGLDLLEALPCVRAANFGVIGHSLGGHNGIFTAVFDERIRVVISSCGFDSFADYKGGDIRGWTSERYMPRLLAYPVEGVPFDFYELIAALAPRPCFVSAPTGDTNFKWKSVAAIARAAAPVYELYGARSRLQVEHPECAHLFPLAMREKAYRLFEEHLLP